MVRFGGLASLYVPGTDVLYPKLPGTVFRLCLCQLEQLFRPMLFVSVGTAHMGGAWALGLLLRTAYIVTLTYFYRTLFIGD